MSRKVHFIAVLFYFYCGCVGSVTVIALHMMGGDKHEANVLLCTRVRRMLDVQKNVDDDRIEMLERMIREASDTVMESERKYEEVQLFRSLFCFVFLVDCYHLSVCLLCNAVTFENLDPESSFSVCTYTFRIFILIPFIKVVRLRYCFLISAGIRQDGVLSLVWSLVVCLRPKSSLVTLCVQECFATYLYMYAYGKIGICSKLVLHSLQQK